MFSLQIQLKMKPLPPTLLNITETVGIYETNDKLVINHVANINFCH